MAAVTKHRKGGGCQNTNAVFDDDEDVSGSGSDSDVQELDETIATDGVDDAMPVIDITKILIDNPFMEINIEEENDEQY